MDRRMGILGIGLLTAVLGAPIPGDSIASEGGKSAARRSEQGFLVEAPYPKLTGPLHSCRGLEARGTFPGHWGAITAVGDIEVDPRTMDRRWDSSIPLAAAGDYGFPNAWVNLDYATRMGRGGSPPRYRVVALPGTETFSLTLDGWTTSRTTTNARDSEGLPVQNEVNFYGLLYTAGTFSLQGSGSFFGAVVAGGGMGEGEVGASSGGKASIYFDARLSRGGWPPPELELPLTVMTASGEH